MAFSTAAWTPFPECLNGTLHQTETFAHVGRVVSQTLRISLKALTRRPVKVAHCSCRFRRSYTNFSRSFVICALVNLSRRTVPQCLSFLVGTLEFVAGFN